MQFHLDYLSVKKHVKHSLVNMNVILPEGPTTPVFPVCPGKPDLPVAPGRPAGPSRPAKPVAPCI